jgi:hypothetical protein
MLCGDHEIVDIYPGLVNDILSGSFYGVIECAIQVPEQLKDYFAEMLPCLLQCFKPRFVFMNKDVITLL